MVARLSVVFFNAFAAVLCCSRVRSPASVFIVRGVKRGCTAKLLGRGYRCEDVHGNDSRLALEPDALPRVRRGGRERRTYGFAARRFGLFRRPERWRHDRA